MTLSFKCRFAPLLFDKDDNAGKPGFEPWTNSFAVICNNKQNFDFFFWLIYGLWRDGKFKTRHRGSVIPFINLQDVRDLIRELLEFVDDVIDDLRSRKEIRHIHTILERGTSADDQLRVWQETGDVKAVVDRLIETTMENVPHEAVPHEFAVASL